MHFSLFISEYSVFFFFLLVTFLAFSNFNRFFAFFSATCNVFFSFSTFFFSFSSKTFLIGELVRISECCLLLPVSVAAFLKLVDGIGCKLEKETFVGDSQDRIEDAGDLQVRIGSLFCITDSVKSSSENFSLSKGQIPAFTQIVLCQSLQLLRMRFWTIRLNLTSKFCWMHFCSWIA